MRSNANWRIIFTAVKSLVSAFLDFGPLSFASAAQADTIRTRAGCKQYQWGGSWRGGALLRLRLVKNARLGQHAVKIAVDTGRRYGEDRIR
jgi:hypothetical protein